METVSTTAASTAAASKGRRMLITRPAGQHAPLLKACRALGLDTVHWPCLIIESLPSPDVATQLQQVCGPVLFTSTNAVQAAHQIRPLPWAQSPAYAIGAASARTLLELNQPVAVAPLAPYNSESCLQLLASRDPGSLSIIKGMGGRTLIRDTLLQQGWQVKTIDVYRRRKPTAVEADAASVFITGRFDLVSVGSDEVLCNLLALSQPWIDQLLDTQLIVNSHRCARLAAQHGFRQPAMVADPAGDEGQLGCVRQWLDRHQKVS